ncbi:GntR family transcriptional regulator [Streptomyces sp. NPDC058667]|uniref:GntR family transcriptional regulator n=1 Tax=Streptomyces sp. NPDC058667 TaxID=3346588 RepID=UPI003666A101
MAQGYAEIAAHFRQQIQDGVLQPGDTMPSMREVSERFGVAQTTVNRAFRVLKTEGLTLPKAGVGTVVAGPISNNIGARVALHAATGSALGGGESSRILEVGTVGADELVASRLDVAPGTPVHMRRRVVSRGSVPVHMSTSYYPAYVMAVTPELAEPVSTGASRELAAERLGVAQDRVLYEFMSRHATEAEKETLGITAGGPLPVSQEVRTVYLADERIVEVAIKVANGSTILRHSMSLR